MRQKARLTIVLKPGRENRIVQARLRSWWLFGLVGLTGCHGAAMQKGPSDTLRAYAHALEEGRADDAYALLSEEARRSISREAFRRMVQESPNDVLEVARALARPANDPQITATLVSPQGETLVLVFEGGAWKIDASALDFYAQTTPRKAIESFVRAYERKRYDILLRFVPNAHREHLDAAKLAEAWSTDEQREEMDRIALALRVALPTAVIEEHGDRASMAYGSGGLVQLVREQGVWKIEDFE